MLIGLFALADGAGSVRLTRTPGALTGRSPRILYLSPWSRHRPFCPDARRVRTLSGPSSPADPAGYRSHRGAAGGPAGSSAPERHRVDAHPDRRIGQVWADGQAQHLIGPAVRPGQASAPLNPLRRIGGRLVADHGIMDQGLATSASAAASGCAGRDHWDQTLDLAGGHTIGVPPRHSWPPSAIWPTTPHAMTLPLPVGRFGAGPVQHVLPLVEAFTIPDDFLQAPISTTGRRQGWAGDCPCLSGRAPAHPAYRCRLALPLTSLPRFLSRTPGVLLRRLAVRHGRTWYWCSGSSGVGTGAWRGSE